MLEFEGSVTVNDLVIKVHQPDGTGPFPVMVMIHGWTGNENSMWVFAPRLPKNALLLAPRAIYSTTGSGYSWYPKQNSNLPWFADFHTAVDKLLGTLSQQYFPAGDFSTLQLLGFSQGAALAYCMAILHPEHITSLAGLSGFLPDGASTWLHSGRLNGLPVFIAHGTQDERVPVERARTAVAQFEQAGAQVTYCEDDVGHKLSAKCFRGMEAFFQKVDY